MIQCINCGEYCEDILFSSSDYFTHENFSLIRCKTCGLIITEPQTIESKYYPGFYYGNNGKRFPKIIEDMINRSRLHRAEIVNRLFSKPGVVVDMGCGRGIMLKQLNKYRWTSIGIEINKTLLDNLINQNIIVLEGHDLSVLHSRGYTNKIDVITFFHSLEHMQNPIELIKNSSRLLKTNGLLIIEVPNLSSIQYMLAKSKWFHLDVPRHLYHFKLPVLKKILQNNNYRINNISTFSFEYGVFGFAQSILNLISPTLNFTYLLLLAPPKNIRNYKLIDYLLIPAVIPLTIIGCFVELISSTIKKGSIIRIIAQKLD